MNIADARMHSQRLVAPAFETPGEVVRWMGAMQAQDYHQAVWAIGSRMANPALTAVETAIDAGDILRTWPMRGTIHFVAAEEARWRVELAADRIRSSGTARRRQLDLTDDDVNRCRDIAEKRLAGRRRMQRGDLLRAFEEGGVSTAGQRGYHILGQLALQAVLCIGPNDGKQQTYVLLDDWTHGAPSRPRDEALAELTRRYAISHGPATAHDLAWWAGITVTDARAGFEAARPDVTPRDIDGTVYWSADGTGDQTVGAGHLALLAGFDEYLLGYQNRDAVIDRANASAVCPGGNGVFYPMIVVGGQIVGTWRRTLRKGLAVIGREVFPGVTVSDDAFASAARRYAAFHGLSVAFET
ncbi:MAG: winged helix DNA-binding domain-containing protein [Phototrophicaceae bacterium]